MKSFYTW